MLYPNLHCCASLGNTVLNCSAQIIVFPYVAWAQCIQTPNLYPVPTGDFWISTAFHTDQPPVSDELTLLCQLILKRFFFCTVSGTLFFGKTKRKCGGHSTRQSRVSRSNCYILQNQNIPSLICPAISIIFKIIRIPHTAFSPHVSFLSVTTRMQKNTKRRLIIKDIHSCLFTICRINRPIIAAHNMIFTIQIPVGFLNFNFISWSFLSKATMLECSRFSHEISFRPTAAAVGHPRSR